MIGLSGCGGDPTEPDPTATSPDSTSAADPTTRASDPLGSIPGPAGDYASFDTGNFQPTRPDGYPAELAAPNFDCWTDEIYAQLGLGFEAGADGRWRHDCIANLTPAAWSNGSQSAMSELAANFRTQGLTVSDLAECDYPVAGPIPLPGFTYFVVTGLSNGGTAAVYAMTINIGEDDGDLAPNEDAWSVSIYFRPDGVS
jgi:hypothetical protein